MTLDQFLIAVKSLVGEEELLDFCRKHVLHGNPHVFNNRENDFYEFRKVISNKFNISFHEIYITGSGKLGFSPFKRKLFDYNSDIDVALISSILFENIMNRISSYQMRFRKSRDVVRETELEMYHAFLEYVALGWIRPDKLPISFQMKTLKDDWFKFFNSISYGNSLVGNYKVSAGVFKNYECLEKYIVSGLEDIRNLRLVERRN